MVDFASTLYKGLAILQISNSMWPCLFLCIFTKISYYQSFTFPLWWARKRYLILSYAYGLFSLTYYVISFDYFLLDSIFFTLIGKTLICILDVNPLSCIYVANIFCYLSFKCFCSKNLIILICNFLVYF